jgi:hypothetical protein
MATTNSRKSATKKRQPTIKEVMASLEKVAPQAERINALPPDKLSEQLGVQSKRSAEKKAIVKRLDEVSRLVKTVRQAFVSKQVDLWAQEARQKSVKNLERLVSKRILIKAGELLEQLGWTRQALSKARKARRVFSVEIKGESYYPAYFVDPQYERRQLEAVSKALGDLPGTSKLQFMITPKGSLGSLTPLEALAKGKIADVKIAAEGFVNR